MSVCDGLTTLDKKAYMFPRFRPASLAIASLLLAGSWSPAGAQTEASSLHILLTNDDGYEAPGIRAMYQALRAAGHDVVMVAPSTNQSGTSAQLSSGVLTYSQASEDVWHIDASPATAVLFALDHLMPDAVPDLVVSGTNSGQNIGTSTSHSGTVGAAVTAARRGIPAIAVSAETASGRGAMQFEAAAEWTVHLIEGLNAQRERNGSLLPPGLVLNANYPSVPADELLGVRVEPVSDASSFRRVFSETGVPGQVRVTLRSADRSAMAAGTDVALLAQGYIVVNLIRANGNVEPSELDDLARRLGLGATGSGAR